MVTMTKLELIYRAFKCFDGFDGPHTDELWWRTDYEGEKIKLLINCNDLFMCGCADCEELTEENIKSLEDTLDEAEKCGEGCRTYGHLLAIARWRKCVPQEPYFKFFPDTIHHLFRSAGEFV